MGVGFENTCTVLGKWNVPRVATRIYGWVYKIRKTTPIISSTTVSHSAGSQSVVITVSPEPGAQVRILWVANFRLHTCLHSLTPTTYFREQLWSYWTPSHKDPERWLFASSFKHIVHILLYIFLIVFYSHCIYVITTSPHKEIFFSEIHKIITSLYFPSSHSFCLSHMQ